MRLEDVMALENMFGDTQGLGPAAETDPRRRRAGMGSGYEGIAGGLTSLMDLLPRLQGLRTYDYSGPGSRGLAGLAGLTADDIRGPALRNIQQGGFDVPPGLEGRSDLPPGLDQRNAIGGPNVAPGNLGNYQANYQPPVSPGRPHPQTQGWLNVAPGYGIASKLGFGTPAFGARLAGEAEQGIGGRVGPPGLRGAEAGGGGPVAAAGGPSAVQNLSAPSGGGGGAPAAPRGGGGGGTTGIGGGRKGGVSGIQAKERGAATGPPRATTVKTNKKTGITTTVSKGGGEGKYKNITPGKGTSDTDLKTAIIKSGGTIQTTNQEAQKPGGGAPNFNPTPQPATKGATKPAKPKKPKSEGAQMAQNKGI